MPNVSHSAWIQMRRTPYQAFGAILVLCVTFVVAYFFSLLVYGSEVLLRYFETRPQVTAFFKQETTDEQIRSLQETMQAKPYVDEVQVISKNDALAIYKEDNQQDPLSMELVTADILPASIEISGRDIEALSSIQQDLSAETEIVDEVVYQEQVVDTVGRWIRAIRIAGFIIVGALALTSIVVMVVVISMKVAMKRQEIGIMRLLGATKWYILAPFMVEALWYSIGSALIGWGIVTLGMLYATPWIVDFFGEIQIIPLPVEFIGAQIGIGVLFAIILSFISSSMALRRVVKS